jgi:hypothetical protein
MSVLRTHALDRLICAIEEAVPDLEGKICKMGEPQKARVWPTLQVLPVRFKYFPMQEHFHADISRSKAIFDVGRHEGTVQLRLGATTSSERYRLEDAIIDLFVSQEGRPGILLTEIDDCHDAVVAWELDDDEWDNEKVFTKEYFSILTVRVQIPTLVYRDSVYTIEEIRLSLTEDLQTEYSSLPDSSIETLGIDEDGNLTKYP